MARPTEKYIEPINTNIKDVTRAMFGGDVKNLSEEKNYEELERVLMEI